MTNGSDRLELGTKPDGLTVNLTKGDPWSAQLVLLNADETPRAWSPAPVLEFTITLTGDDGPLNLTATLDADTETSTANARATWTLTEDQVDQLCAKPTTKVRLSVGGVTWYSGRISCRS